jgi:hypothetical protein
VRVHRPAARRRASLLAAAAIALGVLRPLPLAGASVAGGMTVRAEGRAPVQGGRADTAFQQALEESFRRGILEALRTVAPERQSPRDLETWQDTVLSRAQDFVAAWRILAEEQRDGFLRLETEMEIWRDKLARAARASGAVAASPAVRVVVLADPLPLTDPSSDEEVDAGRAAAVAIEAEFARRGAVIVSTTNRAPWLAAEGPASEENRVALAASEGKRLEADAVLIAALSRRGAQGYALAVQLVSSASEATLGSARAEGALPADGALADAFVPAARQVAAALFAHLAAARSGRARSAAP